MNKNIFIKNINEELSSLKNKLSEKDYNKFIDENPKIKLFNTLSQNKLTKLFLSNLFLKQVLAIVHDKNYY